MMIFYYEITKKRRSPAIGTQNLTSICRRRFIYFLADFFRIESDPVTSLFQCAMPSATIVDIIFSEHCQRTRLRYGKLCDGQLISFKCIIDVGTHTIFVYDQKYQSSTNAVMT